MKDFKNKYHTTIFRYLLKDVSISMSIVYVCRYVIFLFIYDYIRYEINSNASLNSISISWTQT